MSKAVYNDEMSEVLLENVPEKLRSASDLVKNVPYEIRDFAGFLASVSKDTLNPADMMEVVICTLADIEADNYNIPTYLWGEGRKIDVYIRYFPLIIDEIASEEFAKDFRELFEDMLCKPWPPVDKNKEEYGVTILENGLVDISNKDKAEVLASLYNNSHPQGLGFHEFRPEPMTLEEAREILKEKAIFDYLYGRVMKINLENDLVCTSWYNKVNGEGAAEKAISQCPNLK